MNQKRIKMNMAPTKKWIADIKKSVRIFSITPNFQPVDNFKRINSQKKCRQKCGTCERQWGETKTANVHLVILQDNRQFFTCSDCLDELQTIFENQKLFK